LALVAAFAVIFAAAFALGRSGTSTTTTPHEGVQWAVPQASVGTAIPARLTTAPPIEIEKPPPPTRHSSSQVGGGSSGRSATVGQSLATEAPAPAASPSRPAPVPTPAPPAAPAPVEHSSSSGGASAPKSGSSGGGVTQSSQPGQTFESSG
jgi:hypothetical protein